MHVSINQVINSAIWAAYGDALGFITELADASGVMKRAGVESVNKTIPWKRLVGGRFGATIDLPEGCYSDDTQLRLATSRAIRGSGDFDVEAFAKVEIPVWLSYALGAGRGTKIAAASLAKDNINWFSNFFDGTAGRYVDTGGNGAAMRIQPHVWSARGNTDSYLRDVLRNSICTHGHARGFLGAVFHAVCLAHALESHAYPGPDAWEKAVKVFSLLPEIVHGDSSLSAFWLPTWERLSEISLSDAILKVQEECMRDIELVISLPADAEPESAYHELVRRMGGLDDKQRGSGTKTAILGAVLPWLFPANDPENSLQTAANLLGSDTDTIATMAGAIIGAVSEVVPSGQISDQKYIQDEARRMYAIRQGETTASFLYPDILRWQAPRTQLDAVGKDGENLYVAGLGLANPIGAEIGGRGKDETIWQWLKMDFGQIILAKRRKNLRPVMAENTSRPAPEATAMTTKNMPRQTSIFDAPTQRESETVTGEKNIDDMSWEAIKSGFNPALIGTHLLELADRKGGIELVIAYSAIIAKAKAARNPRRSQPG